MTTYVLAAGRIGPTDDRGTRTMTGRRLVSNGPTEPSRRVQRFERTITTEDDR